MIHSRLVSEAEDVSSLPLVCTGPVEHIPHACCLLLKELGVLSGLLSPGRVERRGVLVHQVGVLGTSRPTKVFDLERKLNKFRAIKTLLKYQAVASVSKILGMACEAIFRKVKVQESIKHAVVSVRRLTCMTLGKMVLLK